MKTVTYRYYSGAEEQKLTITEAVERCCDGQNYDQGALEDVQWGLKSTIRMLGELVALLYEKGAIEEAELIELLGSRFVVEG